MVEYIKNIVVQYVDSYCKDYDKAEVANYHG